MGLTDLFRRWFKARDAGALERAEDETRMTPYERDVDREDFEARKDDIRADNTFAGRAAEEAAEGELEE